MLCLPYLHFVALLTPWRRRPPIARPRDETNTGPYAIGLFDPRAWGGGNVQVSNAITLEVTRVVLAIGVFAIGVELPSKYMRKHWRSLFFLLVPIMTYGWFVSAGEWARCRPQDFEIPRKT